MRVNLADRVRRNPDRTLTGMDQPDLIAMGQQAGTPFGSVFAEYLKAFAAHDRAGLCAAFAEDARVMLRDHPNGAHLDFSPSAFFDRLEQEVGAARFVIEAYTARFDLGYLIADGLWIQPDGDSTLRAADIFTANALSRNISTRQS